MKTINLTITGMHCASCEKLINMGLTDLAGVSDITVNAATGKASLKIDESLVNEKQILKAVKDAGYEATVDLKTANEPEQKNEIMIFYFY